MKIRVRDGVFMLVWALATLLFFLVFFPCLVSQKWAHRSGQFWARGSLWLADKICGIRSHLRGYNYILNTPAIYAAKHQSTWDTLMLNATLDNAVFVVKRELYLIPIFGWFLWRGGQIAINRKAGRQALETLVTQAQKYAAQGRSIVIFPEGTRVAPNTTPNYKMGVARVSEATQLPVVPVALNAGRVWPRQLIRKRSGTAMVEFLPAMPPAGTAREPWLQDLQNRVEAATERLMKEA